MKSQKETSLASAEGEGPTATEEGVGALEEKTGQKQIFSRRGENRTSFVPTLLATANAAKLCRNHV